MLAKHSPAKHPLQPLTSGADPLLNSAGEIRFAAHWPAILAGAAIIFLGTSLWAAAGVEGSWFLRLAGFATMVASLAPFALSQWFKGRSSAISYIATHVAIAGAAFAISAVFHGLI